MVKVRKGNVLLTVSEDLVSEYVQRGYDVVNNGGAVIQKAVPTDINALQKAYAEQAARIAQLENALENNADAALRDMYKELEKGHEELIASYETLEDENESLKEQIATLQTQLSAHLTEGTKKQKNK